MKHMTIAALLFAFGVASAFPQGTPVKMTLSGTGGPSTINLQTGTGTSEYNLAGKGTLGQFTLRAVSAGTAAPQASSTCSGLYFPILAGEAVFRFQDGSLMKLNLTGGSDCIDPVAQQALCIRTFQVTGGTGRFQNASGGAVTLTMTVSPVVPNMFDFFTVTANIAGTISGVDTDEAAEGGD